MKKSLTIASIIGLSILAGCTPTGTKSKSGIVGTYADNCSAPKSSFTFNNGGSGTIHARGMTRRFTWIKRGSTAYASVASLGGTPAQTYALAQTQNGIYLTDLSVNGQKQNLISVSASERTKVKCS